MVDPTTANVLLAVPTRGSDVGTWDTPVNANQTAADGFFGGVVTVAVSNSPITLSAPTGTVTPSAGPFQSQNRILKFTGTMTANVQITLPLPGEYTIQNLTTGAFVLSFIAVGAGKVIATPQGSIMKIWNDGTDAWLFKSQIPGSLTFLSNVAGTLPGWITAFTVLPYLICDGTVYNISTFPALGGYLGSAFGGNGSTTFGVPDLRGRVALPYDGTGSRITAAICGLNGASIGNAGGDQSLQAHAHGTLDNGHFHGIAGANQAGTNIGVQAGSGVTSVPVAGAAGNSGTSLTGITVNSNGAGVAQNVQPSLVTGVWLIAT